MPGKEMNRIKNEKQYEALRDKGMSKKKAARIANTPDSGKKVGMPVNMKPVPKKNCIKKLKQ